MPFQAGLEGSSAHKQHWSHHVEWGTAELVNSQQWPGDRTNEPQRGGLGDEAQHRTREGTAEASDGQRKGCLHLAAEDNAALETTLGSRLQGGSWGQSGHRRTQGSTGTLQGE